MSFIIRLLLAASLCLEMLGAAAAADNGVAGMVLDLQGTGQINENGKTSKLQLLAYLKPQMQLTLDAGSKASLSLYATKSVYQVSGPALIDIGADKLTVRKGPAPVVKSMEQKLVVAAEASKLTPGAFRMRHLPPRIALSSPRNGGTILNGRPVFSWDAMEPGTYEITVVESPERQVAQGRTSDTSWQLPEGTQLSSGKNYRWTVTYVSVKDGKSYNAAGEFSMAGKAVATEVAGLRPAPDAAIEDWVLYAVILQDRNMHDEARMVWQEIAAKRPDLQKAQELAR